MCEQNRLLYREQIQELGIEDSCPCENCVEPNDVVAYRFMYEPLDDSMNLMPQLLKAKLKGQIPRSYLTDDEKKCDAMGLSSYLEISNALSAFRHFMGFPKMNPKYTCLGKCVLISQDGVVSEPADDGHFNLHPYLDTNILTRFTLETHLTT